MQTYSTRMKHRARARAKINKEYSKHAKEKVLQLSCKFISMCFFFFLSVLFPFCYLYTKNKEFNKKKHKREIVLTSRTLFCYLKRPHEVAMPMNSHETGIVGTIDGFFNAQRMTLLTLALNEFWQLQRLVCLWIFL